MKYILIALSILCATAPLYAQADAALSIITSNESGELHSAFTNLLAKDASKTNERVFVISRRGSIDTLRNIELRRLLQLRAHFANQQPFGNQYPVYAVGEAIEGEGRLEYYLGSVLRLVVYAKKNEVPNYTCCPDYIPPRKPKRRRSGS